MECIQDLVKNIMSGGDDQEYPTNDFELVIKASKSLETILEDEFKAKGDDLHAKIDSATAFLPESLRFKLHYLATIRDKLINDPDYNFIANRTNFIKTFEDAEKEIQDVLAQKDGQATNCKVS
eukprot:CAMPEP_0113935094 /NCGR_PEP_ID=MMETSP1339-20121228/2317_1 /TAXON_ID=94617 /ORGANISM="Fibrocapsa japonica" /LENGTH=122 /DNA_ID=CAMNT_0000937125 /DNA_START=138 /DNA_END=506 /DNA_ORIENTATION=- /assembly_acc=CAM_ASM_000762